MTFRIALSLFLSISFVLLGCSSYESTTLNPYSFTPPSYGSVSSNQFESEINRCIESTCGPARLNTADSDRGLQDRPLHPLFQKMWKDVYEPKIGETVALRTKAANAFLRTREQIQRQVIWRSETNIERAVVNAVATFRLIETIGTKLFRYGPQHVQIDEAVLSKSIPTEELKRAVRSIATHTRIPLYNERYKIRTDMNDYATLRLAAFYPGRTKKEAYQLDVDQIRLKLQILESATGPWIRRFLNFGPEFETLMNRAAANGKLDPWEAGIYETRAAIIDVARLSLNPKYLTAFAELSSLEALIKVFEEKEQIQELVAQPASDPKLRAAKLSSICRKQFGLTFGLTPKAIRDVASVLANVKKGALAIASKHYVSRSSDLAFITNVVDQIQFQYTEPTLNRLRAYRFDLSDKKWQAQEFIKALNASTTLEQKAKTIDLELVARAMSDPVIPNSISAKDELEKDCSFRADVSAIDETNGYDRVRVSAFTASVPEYLIPIVAHEIGHVISFQIKKHEWGGRYSPLLPILNCMAQRNISSREAQLASITDNTTYSEEDLADHFSSNVVLWMQKNGYIKPAATKNMGCAMVNDLGDRYSDHPTLDPAKDSTHSAPVMRLLLIANDLGRVAPGCKDLTRAIEIVAGRSLRCESPAAGY